MDPAEKIEVERALRHNFVFEHLDDDELAALAEHVWLERIPGGSLIVREGDEADALYLVVDGGVNVVKANGQFLAFLGREGFFGEMALFTEGARRSASCRAVVDTTCAIVRKEVLDFFCTARPAAGVKIYRTIIRTLSERLQSTSADLAMLMGAQVQSQTDVSAIVEKARRRKQQETEPEKK
jgi:CRP-like cAMP-binding protein